MLIKRVYIKNFQSYRELEFNYDNLGLSLVSGITGAGKSGLMDAPAWIIFGITSKDGNSDDVKSWFADGDVTQGECEIDTPSGIIWIYRTRGKSGQNDLFYIEQSTPSAHIRGKDMLETQKRIDARLGVSAELFVIGSYLHQFSKADGFFTAKAKERRETMEKIADLTLAVKLSDHSSDARKEAKRDLEFNSLLLSKESGKYEEIQNNLASLTASRDRWETHRMQNIEDLKAKSISFETDKNAQVDKLVSQLEELDRVSVSPSEFDSREAQIKQQLVAVAQIKKEHGVQTTKLYEIKSRLSALTAERDKMLRLKGDQCPTCLGAVNNSNRNGHLKELEASIKDVTASLTAQTTITSNLDSALAAEDTLRSAQDKCRADRANNERLLDKFEALQAQTLTLRASRNNFQDRIKEEMEDSNPFEDKVSETEVAMDQAKDKLDTVELKVAASTKRVSSLTWLYDKSFELRGMLMKRAVSQINDSTNKYLEKYFDASLRVKLSLADSDKLEVEINNNGYTSPFKQLSGGERRMLTLAFSISLMKAAQNRAGVQFPMIMLDESFNGLDDSLKVKAFGLLQELESDYQTILLIDHCEEFKCMFSNRFTVTKTGDCSEIEHLV